MWSNYKKTCKEWWATHGTWVLGTALMLCMVGIGWSASNVRSRLVIHDVRVQHNQELKHINVAFTAALAISQQRYKELAAKAVKTSKQATDTAQKAAQIANQVTVDSSCIPVERDPKLRRWTK